MAQLPSQTLFSSVHYFFLLITTFRFEFSETRAGRNLVMLPEKVLDTEKLFVKSSCKIRLQITKLWTRLDFAARSCCDLDLQGNDLNVERDTSSQYGDHFCEIVSKSDFK